MNKLFCYLLALVFTTSHANASIFDGVNSNHNLYIHTQAYPKPEPASFLTLNWQFAPQSQKLAATHWLPDFQEAFNSRKNDGGSKDKDINCSDYVGGLSSCPTPKTGKKIAGTNCVTNCKCPISYKYTNAKCQTDFGADYQAGPNLCDDKANSCVAKPCSAGGYFDSTQANLKCSGITYGGRICQSCYQPQCSEGGFDTAQKVGFICTSQPYYGRTCYACSADPCYNLSVPSQPYGCQATYSQCPSKCQIAYPDNCRNRTAKSCDYGCQSNFSDCSNKCEICKRCIPNTLISWSTSVPTNCSQGVDTASDNCGTTKYNCKTCESVNKINLETCWTGGILKCLIPAN